MLLIYNNHNFIIHHLRMGKTRKENVAAAIKRRRQKMDIKRRTKVKLAVKKMSSKKGLYVGSK